MMNTYNTIILLHGSAVLTTKEFRKTLLGDRVFGVDSDPEEIARWPIAEEAAALAELKNTHAKYRTVSGTETPSGISMSTLLNIAIATKTASL